MDTNVFIHAFETTPAMASFHKLFISLAKNPGSAVTSEYTYGELLGREGSFASWSDQKRFYKALIYSEGRIAVTAVDQSILVRSGDLRAAARRVSRSLLLADAIHVATALATDCDCFTTTDARLRRALPATLPGLEPTEAALTSLIESLDA